MIKLIENPAAISATGNISILFLSAEIYFLLLSEALVSSIGLFFEL